MAEFEPRCEGCGEIDEELRSQLWLKGKTTITMPPMNLRSAALCAGCRKAERELLTWWRSREKDGEALPSAPVLPLKGRLQVVPERDGSA